MHVNLIAFGAGLLASANGAAVSMYRDLAAMNPSPPVYPSKSTSDAPYSVPEAMLRSAISMPANFTFGQKPPVLLAPGTGVTGQQTFQGNFLKLLTTDGTMDPVVLNIPDNLLDDVQVNAEYLAYACNYVSAVSMNKNVSVVTWSQGSIDMQWAAKYWPSTQSVVSDFVAISPDIKGTTVADNTAFLDGNSAFPAALFQQKTTALVVKTLRNNGGDSALVPTTAIYSSSDQVVQPQDNTTAASGFFLDTKGVGASNTLVQAACPGQPAGGMFAHEGVLYNPVAFALAMDAFKNPGPGMLSRLDLATVCGSALTPGLNANDKNATDSTIALAANNVVGYPFAKTVKKEPPIAAYAAKDTPAN